MSKYFMPPYGVNDVGVADIVLSWESNAAGAVDQATIRGLKVASVTKGATGIFTVVLTEDVYRVLFSNATVAGLPTADGARAVVHILDETASPLTMVVTALNAAGTAADPIATRRVYVHLMVKLSSV